MRQFTTFLGFLLLTASTVCQAQDTTPRTAQKTDSLKTQGPVKADERQTSADSEAADSLRWEQMLEGVTVAAQKPLIKTEIDRVGYDVQADESSKTDNVLEMLKKVPFVSVDAQENIQVKGNSQYKIYRNGHYDPNLSKNAKELFRAMPASMVKRIEVITEPGAKEDAEGVDAILNIVMMDGQGLEGLTGTVTGRGASNGRAGVITSLTTQVGKAIMSVDYGFQHESEKSTRSDRIADRTFTATGTNEHAESRGSNPGNIHFADLSASYDIDSLNLLSASFGGYFYKLDVQGEGSTSVTDADGQPRYSYIQKYFMPSYSHQSWDGRADYEHRTHRKGETLTLSYMLSLIRQRTVQQNEYTEKQNVPFDYSSNSEHTRERFTEHTFQIDWTRPLWEGQTLSTGLKYIERRNSSHTLQQFDDSPQSTTYDNRFNHNTHIAAAYADYTYTLRKWTLRAGLRYEHSYMSAHYPDGKDDDFGRHLNDWVPQASLKYQINDRQSLKLDYTTSIRRPGISYLNPAEIISPEVVSTGNPGLTSNHSQRIALVYMLTGQKLTLQLAPSYSFFDSGIGRLIYAENDIRHLTYGNIEQMRQLRMEGYVQWKPFSTTTLVVNASLWYDDLENSSAGLRQHGWGGFCYASLSQKLPWKLSFTVNAWGSLGNSPNNVYSYSRPYCIYAMGLQRSFLSENRLTVSLRANAPFNKRFTSTDITNQGDYTGFDKSIMYTRRAELSVSFKFGKLKASVKKASHTIENSDMVGGIKKQ